MNTAYFRYALEVERACSISQAADRLFISQPSLSKAIKEMEDSLGFMIFERGPRGVVPTEAGRKFLISARRIIKEMETLENIGRKDGEECRSLRVSLPRSSYLAEGFVHFLAETEIGDGVEITMQETDSMQVIADVAGGQSNLGVIHYHPAYTPYFADALKERGLRGELIWESDYQPLFSIAHPLSHAPVVPWNQLRRGVELIGSCEGCVPFLSPQENESRRPHPTAARQIMLTDRADQLEALSRIPLAFLWSSPVPKDLRERYHLCQRPCPLPNHQFRDVLIYSDGYRFSPLERKLIDKLYSAKNEVAFEAEESISEV